MIYLGLTNEQYELIKEAVKDKPTLEYKKLLDEIALKEDEIKVKSIEKE